MCKCMGVCDKHTHTRINPSFPYTHIMYLGDRSTHTPSTCIVVHTQVHFGMGRKYISHMHWLLENLVLLFISLVY